MAPSSSVHTPTGPSMGHGFSLGKKKHSLMRMMTPPTPKPSKMKVRFLIASFKKKQDESVHNILRNCIFFLLTFAHSELVSSDFTSLLCFSTRKLDFYTSFDKATLMRRSTPKFKSNRMGHASRMEEQQSYGGRRYQQAESKCQWFSAKDGFFWMHVHPTGFSNTKHERQKAAKDAESATSQWFQHYGKYKIVCKHQWPV